MGNCIASGNGEVLEGWPPAAVVIHHEGGILEYSHPTRASHVMSLYPGCFLCCAETMLVDSHAVRLHPNEQLQSGQIYFLLPASRLHRRLTLSDMCELAVAASSALGRCDITLPTKTWAGEMIVSRVGKVCPDGGFVPALGTIDEAF